MKRTAFDHPKLRKLCRLLNVPKYAAVGILELTWHFTAKHAIAGDIGKWSDEEIADALDWPGDKAGELITALSESGFLDEHPWHRLVVHDWHDHADQSTKKTLQKYGVAFASEKDCGTGDADQGRNHSALVANHSGTVPYRSGQPEPEPEPEPEPTTGSASADVPAGLLTLIDTWNKIGPKVVGAIAHRDPPSKAAIKGWRRAQREFPPELKQAIANLAALEAAVREATFCHRKAWFSVPWLFATNKAGEWHLEVLLRGGYAQNGHGHNATVSPARVRQRNNDDYCN